MRMNKKKSQGQDKSPPSNALVCVIFDSNHQKPKIHNLPGLNAFNRKERKRRRNRRSKLRSIKQMTKSNDQQTNQTMLPVSNDLYEYILKQDFNAYLSTESRERP
jgi:hypothetical protein